MSQVRLLVDEDAQHRDLAPELRARGVDVVTVFEAGLTGEADVAVLAFAISQGRAVYTFNTGDFCRLHSEYLQQGLEHTGIIVVPSQRYSLGEQLRRLLRLVGSKSAEDFVSISNSCRDTMSQEVPEPILNSPFTEPEAYWHIVEGEPPQRRDGRQPAMYFYRDPKQKLAAA